MWTAVVAASAAILGVAVGRMWDSRAESSRWRRDQRMASYQRLAEAYRTSYDQIQTIAFADPRVHEYSGLVRNAVIQGNSVWHGALSATWFHGSLPVIAAATTLDRALAQLHSQVVDRLVTVADWGPLRAPARQAFEEYIEAVRRELSLPAVPLGFYHDTADPQPQPE